MQGDGAGKEGHTFLAITGLACEGACVERFSVAIARSGKGGRPCSSVLHEAQYFAKMFEPVLRRANHRFPFALFAPSREISARGVEPHAKPRSREIQFPGAENSR
ncbi:protein of unknown function [Methanoculleus bourgensis]|uniref:Uncharacterized protein n=1 Tax=Methanoculleus bourgensis TaxID=83986 RepID=A0A0X3BNG3_9EURY|nr:protein of unknown function [Methanoculleus bourgensis]